jgi:hypothetical protein
MMFRSIRRLAALVMVALLAACSGGGDPPATLGEVADPTPTPRPVAPTTAVNPADVGIEPFAIDGTIPEIETELPLRVESGTWAVVEGQLTTGDIPNLLPYFLIADAGSPEGLRQVTLPQTANGAGLAFRFVNRRNHFKLTAAPNFATWALAKVVRGEETPLGNVGVAEAGAGTTIGVLLSGETITITVNGRPVRSLDDPDLADATGMGIIAEGGESAIARFDDMVVIAIEAGSGGLLESAAPPTPEPTRRPGRPPADRETATVTVQPEVDTADADPQPPATPIPPTPEG